MGLLSKIIILSGVFIIAYGIFSAIGV